MKVLATVHLLPPEEGGRKRPLGVGDYRPTTTVTQDGKTNSWSIQLRLLRQDEDGIWYALAGFVFEQAPSELLYPGNEIELFEGPHVVGHLRVLAPADVVEELIATAH